MALHYIQPGKPDQNAYIERFNRSYRTEVLNAHLFESIAELRALTTPWLQIYNEERPHDSLGLVPPLTFPAEAHNCRAVSLCCVYLTGKLTDGSARAGATRQRGLDEGGEVPRERIVGAALATAAARNGRGGASRPAPWTARHARAAPAHLGRSRLRRTRIARWLSGRTPSPRPRVCRRSGAPCGPSACPLNKTVRPSEHDRPDVAAARVAWHAAAPTWDVAHLVFLDETGITTKLLRRYGRAPRGARVHDHAPCGRWQTSTFLAALRVTGLTAPGVFDGAIDGESFRAYIEQILVPTLQPGDIVIADNPRGPQGRPASSGLSRPPGPHSGTCHPIARTSIPSSSAS